MQPCRQIGFDGPPTGRDEGEHGEGCDTLPPPRKGHQISQSDELRRYVADAEAKLQTGDTVDWITPAPGPPVRVSETGAAIGAAASLSIIGALPDDTRLAGVKKGALRALRLITLDQNLFNAAVVDALRSLEASNGAVANEMRDQVAKLASTVASLESEFDRMAERLGTETTRLESLIEDGNSRLEDSSDSLSRNHSELHDSHRQLVALVEEISHTLGAKGDRLEESRAELVRLQSVVAGLGREAGRQQESLRLQDDRLTVLLREARRRLPEVLEEQQLRTFSNQLERRFDALYTEFENRYRGSREDVLAKLEIYRDLLDFDAISALGPVVDVGSGRGEWIEFLGRHGVAAYGIDVNADIGAAAESRGLDVRVEDGLEHLTALTAESIGMVSMFHVVEHLEFETLFDVMRAAVRALAPGGVLLMETPNPSNLTVGASSFYLDPTHVAPVHPQLLEFLSTAAGFEEAEVHYINPPIEPPFRLSDDLGSNDEMRRILDHLNWALLGPLDYALIARKGSAESP